VPRQALCSRGAPRAGAQRKGHRHRERGTSTWGAARAQAGHWRQGQTRCSLHHALCRTAGEEGTKCVGKAAVLHNSCRLVHRCTPASRPGRVSDSWRRGHKDCGESRGSCSHQWIRYRSCTSGPGSKTGFLSVSWTRQNMPQAPGCQAGETPRPSRGGRGWRGVARGAGGTESSPLTT